MKPYLLLLVAFAASPLLHAQVTVETGHSGQTKDGALIVYGSDNLRNAIPLERIKGSPFWKDNWTKAFFFDQRDTPMGSYQARFNFATNEVHYLDKKGEEQVIIPGTLNTIVFMQENDSAEIASVFRINLPEVKRKAACKTCYAQNLNDGYAMLLRITQRQLKTKDSLFGTLKSYYFADDVEYFVQYGQQYHRMKRLNKDMFLSFLPGSSAYKEWIQQKELRFNKENDYLVFLEHYNSTHQRE